MNPVRVSFISFREEQEGQSVYVEWLKMEKAQGQTAESLVWGIWKPRVSEAKWGVRLRVSV